MKSSMFGSVTEVRLNELGLSNTYQTNQRLKIVSGTILSIFTYDELNLQIKHLYHN